MTAASLLACSAVRSRARGASATGHGVMLTTSNLLDDHENWLEHVEHMKEAAAGAPRQADLYEVGFVDPTSTHRNWRASRRRRHTTSSSAASSPALFNKLLSQWAAHSAGW